MKKKRRKVKRSRQRSVKRRVRKVTPSRKRNPRAGVALYAQARGTPILKYTGGIKFARVGVPVRFANRLLALQAGRELKREFPMLRKFKLWAA